MSHLINLVSLETYNNLLESYNDLTEDLKKNPLIRRPNKFYESMDAQIIASLSNDRFKYYVLRDVLPSKMLLESLFVYEYFYQLSINNINNSVFLSINRLSHRQVGGINIVIMIVDISANPCLNLKLISNPEFELFVPQSIFTSAIGCNYFTMIINRNKDKTSDMLICDIPSFIDITEFHNILPYLWTDIGYLRYNIERATNQMYKLFDYFLFSQHVEFMNFYYDNDSHKSVFRNNFSIRSNIIFYIDSITTDEHNTKHVTRFIHVDDFNCDTLFVKKPIVEGDRYLYQSECEIFEIPNQIEFNQFHIKKSLGFLNIDLILFKKFKLYCQSIEIYNNKNSSLNIYLNCKYFNQIIECPLMLKKFLEDIDPLESDGTINYAFVKYLAQSVSCCLNKFQSDSLIEEIVALIEKYERLNSLNEHTIQQLHILEIETKMKLPTVHTNEVNERLITWLDNEIMVLEQSIAFHVNILSKLQQVSLRDICRFEPHSLKKVENVFHGIFKLEYNNKK